MAQEERIGMIGLGVMGRNLLLNMADHGFQVAGFDLNPDQVSLLTQEAGDLPVRPSKTMKDFLASLRRPRVVMMMVPAGKPVDAVIHELLPHLEKGDVVIDGGNSHYNDTDIRAKALAEKGLHFLGVGISGGEEGARNGPSMMPGGPREAYDTVRDILDASAARVGDDPCVTWLGPGSAGHYVKMVHNGIEYALMQLIAEAYDLMKRGLGLENAEMGEIFGRWDQAELGGFLVEITSKIFTHRDPRSGGYLLDVILDAANQLGTGMWTSQNAMTLQVPAPTIHAAVSARDISSMERQRRAAEKRLSGPDGRLEVADRQAFLESLRRALYASMIVGYAQGMALLSRASERHGYGYRLADVARIWRGGCIIRSKLLEPIREAYVRAPALPNLLDDNVLGQEVVSRQKSLREVVCQGAGAGIPVPALAAGLAYFDAYRSGWLPANMIQAQRDFFGAHAYERIDERGVFHTTWE